MQPRVSLRPGIIRHIEKLDVKDSRGEKKFQIQANIIFTNISDVTMYDGCEITIKLEKGKTSSEAKLIEKERKSADNQPYESTPSISWQNPYMPQTQEISDADSKLMSKSLIEKMDKSKDTMTHEPKKGPKTSTLREDKRKKKYDIDPKDWLKLAKIKAMAADNKNRPTEEGSNFVNSTDNHPSDKHSSKKRKLDDTKSDTEIKKARVASEEKDNQPSSNKKPEKRRKEKRGQKSKTRKGYYTDEQKKQMAEKRKKRKEENIIMPQMRRDSSNYLRDKISGKFLRKSNRLTNIQRRKTEPLTPSKGVPCVTEVKVVKIKIKKLKAVRRKHTHKKPLPRKNFNPPRNNAQTSTKYASTSHHNHPTSFLKKFHFRINPEIKLTEKLQLG